MTLWNLIRDFFVEHLFGGRLSTGDLVSSNLIGDIYSVTQGQEDILTGTNSTTPFVGIGSGFFPDMFDNGTITPESGQTTLLVGLGDWLSTTFTIITLVLLVIFLYIFVKWIFKLFSGLLK